MKLSGEYIFRIREKTLSQMTQSNRSRSRIERSLMLLERVREEILTARWDG